jgi:hypothetical protein
MKNLLVQRGDLSIQKKKQVFYTSIGIATKEMVLNIEKNLTMTKK